MAELYIFLIASGLIPFFVYNRKKSTLYKWIAVVGALYLLAETISFYIRAIGLKAEYPNNGEMYLIFGMIGFGFCLLNLYLLIVIKK
jgi:hypothetical protein